MTEIEEQLNKLKTPQLIDIVKNYRQYGYDENLRFIAISILEDRGITKNELELTGNFNNATYDSAEGLYNSFCKNSSIAFICYSLVMLLTFLNFAHLFNSNDYNSAFIILKYVIFSIYLYFIIRSFLNQSQFYKTIGQDYGIDGALVYVIIGMPFLYIYVFLLSKSDESKNDWD